MQRQLDLAIKLHNGNLITNTSTSIVYLPAGVNWQAHLPLERLNSIQIRQCTHNTGINVTQNYIYSHESGYVILS